MSGVHHTIVRKIARPLAAILLAVGLILAGAPALAQSSTAYTYDALGRLTSAVNSDGTQVNYAYDPAGNRTQLSGNGGSISVANLSLTVMENTAGSTGLSASGPYTTLNIAAQPTHGAVSLNGAVATYTPASGYVGSDSFTYTATGPTGTSAPGTVSVTVTNSSAPVVGAVSATVAENAVNTPITLNISGAGVTSVAATTPIHGTATASGTAITYTPTTGYSGPDSFTYTATNAAGTSDPATVSITVNASNVPIAGAVSYTVSVNSSFTSIPLNLSGGATINAEVVAQPANGEADTTTPTVIVYMPNQGFSGTDSFTYNASNNAGTSAPATVSITVAPVTTAPTAGPVNMTVVYDSKLNNVPLNISGGAWSSIAVVSLQSHGTIYDSNSTSLAYTPTPGYAGSDSFTYNASNAIGTSSPATVSITITPPALPVAGATSATAYEDIPNTPIKLNLSGGPTDTVAIVTPPGAGTTTVTGAAITYTPVEGFLGTDSFTYTATNFSGTSAPATVSLTIVVPPLPVASNSSATVTYQTAKTLPLGLSGGPSTSVTIITPPTNGTATTSGASITYTPNSGYYGSDSLIYTVANVTGSSGQATVAITVNPPPPIANATNASVPYNATNYPIALNLTGGPAASVVVGQPGQFKPQHGTVAASGAIVTYTPTSGYIGSDRFQYYASNAGGSSASANVYITVAPPPPIANATSAAVGYNSTGSTITPSTGGGTATAVAVATAPSNGTVTASGTTFTYVPTSGYIGSDSFTYTASNTGGTSTPATVTVTVNPPPPIAANSSASVPYNSSGAVIPLNLSGGAATRVTLTGPGTQGPRNGTVSASGATVTYIPTSGYTGSDSFQYYASNAGGGSASATVSITVLPAPPVAGAASATVGYNSTGATITPTLTGGTATSLAVATAPTNGTATVSGTTFTYVPTSGYIGPDSFTYTASNTGGTSAPATVTITVNPPPPVAGVVSASVPYNATNAAITLNISGGTPTSVLVISNDPNYSGPSHGTATASGTTITYTPTSGYIGPDIFYYRASNAGGTSVGAKISVTVLPPPPIAQATSATVGYNSTGSTITPTLTGGTATSLAVVAAPSNGTATVSGTTFTYVPTSGYSGADSFTYTASNTGGTSTPATVTVTVNPPPPVAGVVSASVLYNATNAPITLNISGGTPTSVSVIPNDPNHPGPSHGTAAASGTSITYTPTSGYTGSDSFYYQASNAGGTSASAKISLTVLPAPPIAGATSASVGYNSTGKTIIPTLTGGTATSVTVVAAPTNGTATVSGTTFTYVPTSGYSGSDSFTYTASNAGGTSAPATVTITVNPAPPVANATSASIPYNTATAIPLSLSGGTATSVAVYGQNPSHGTVTVSGATMTYTPTSGYTGSDSFSYVASNAGGTSASARVSITVLVQTPVAHAVSATVNENAGFTTIPLSLSGGTATSVAVTTGPTNGVTAASGIGITYKPNTGYTGSDSFAYTASNAGGASAPATASITVVVPAPPVAGNVAASVSHNTTNNPINLSLSGGAATAVAVVQNPTHGTATASGTSITYTPTTNFMGSDSFTYNASNAGGTSTAATVSVTVH